LNAGNVCSVSCTVGVTRLYLAPKGTRWHPTNIDITNSAFADTVQKAALESAGTSWNQWFCGGNMAELWLLCSFNRFFLSFGLG